MRQQNFSDQHFMYWMLRHNKGLMELAPNLKETPRHIISYVTVEKLKLPKGWYYDGKESFTNQHNSTNGTTTYVRIIFK